MKKITFKRNTILLLLALILALNYSYSQSNYNTAKRISINNPSKSLLQQIQQVGVDLSCGPKFINNNLHLELSYAELLLLDNNGIDYNVLIDDLTAYYKEKFDVELPLAKAALKQEQLLAQIKNASKTLSKKSSLIDNPTQHDECDEIDWAAPSNFKLGTMGGALTLSEAYAELDLMRTMYPNLISVRTDASTSNTKTHGNSTGGTTWSGQEVYYVRISDNPDTDEANEPETLITGAMHAREISSVMNTFYFMWYILENYSTDPFIKNLVDNHEIYVMPISNPDGYRWNEVIAPSGGGLQRKNLRPGVADNGTTSSSNNVRGVDLNRNFNYYWGWDDSGSSPTTSSNTYRGPSAGSEPETQIVQEFIASHDIKVAVNHHGGLNSIVTSSYNGESTAADSGREDEYAKICHDLTHYNRYIYGSAPNTLYEANGDINDWMLGGTSVTSGGQTSSGSGKDVLAFAPENGDDFWPTTTLITDIARRAMRMNFLSVIYSGKYAKLHDLNTSNISSTSGDLTFGVEFLGKTYDDITLTVTPVSSNITSMTSPLVQTSWTKLEQRNLTVPYTLDAGIMPNDEIEYQITLSNDDFIIYRANYVKYYQPSILFQDNDINISNWTTSGGSWGTTTDSYVGSIAITDSPSGAYTNSENKTITLNSTIDLSSSSQALIQFYAKWDLERNYDMVQLEASTNGGSTWTALCGRYNKPAATSLTNFHLTKTTGTHQSTNGNIVYDGDSMDKWVMEEILINGDDNSSLNGQSNVQFRFRFKTDSSNREDDLTTTFDGFIFDDFKILSTSLIACDNSSTPSGISISEVTNNSAFVNWDLIPSATYDVRYKETSSGTWTEVTNISNNFYSITGLSDNTSYDVQVATRCNTTTSSYSSTQNFTTLNPCPSGTITSFPYSENFDSGIGNWIQGENDIAGNNYEDWTLNSGGTTSGQTGPTRDYTAESTGNSTIGNYFYTEATTANTTSNVGTNVTVTLISPCIDLTGYENANFSFYYHMFANNSTDMGDLSVDVSIDYGTNWTTLNTISGEQQTAQADPWLQQNIDLSAYDGQIIKLRFAGATGTGYRSDMAFDEINLTADAITSFTPIASCQNINALLDGSGNVSIVAGDLDDGSSVGNLSIDISSFTCANLGANNVTLTATDPSDSGNTDICVAVVTVTATKPADDVTNATICSGETYTWAANGQDYTTNQTGTTITNDG
ncbi:M14 family zinc carboxypeptidase, partial [uncultured Algibacter sp.]|uniref:M14 family zinc carboxypeptidase n=1 Tax=uncultured Algibacter sp. TaxID=298659 RepID=UPI00260EC69F